MADSSAPITPGVGLSVDTRTNAAGEHREVVVLQMAEGSSLATVTVTNATGAVLAANANRLGAIVWNETGSMIYLALAATASLTAYTVPINAGAGYEVPFGYTAAISAITAAGSATIRVTEII